MMKNHLRSLPILISLALSILVVFQWVRVASLRKEVQTLNARMREKSVVLLDQEAAFRRSEGDNRRLDALKQKLSEQIKSNTHHIALLLTNSTKLENDLAHFKRQATAFKEALDKASDTIVKQNKDIQRQNENLKALVEKRDQMILRFNNLAKDYNALVDRWNRQQEELSASNTNTNAVSPLPDQ